MHFIIFRQTREPPLIVNRWSDISNTLATQLTSRLTICDIFFHYRVYYAPIIDCSISALFQTIYCVNPFPIFYVQRDIYTKYIWSERIIKYKSVCTKNVYNCLCITEIHDQIVLNIS